eukprot:1468773-Amphidinium_carterae.2
MAALEVCYSITVVSCPSAAWPSMLLALGCICRCYKEPEEVNIGLPLPPRLLECQSWSWPKCVLVSLKERPDQTQLFCRADRARRRAADAGRTESTKKGFTQGCRSLVTERTHLSY